MSNLIFLLFLFLIFLIEGLGIKNSWEIVFYLLLLMPFLLYLPGFISQQKTYFPKTLSVLFFIFIFFSTISTIFSINIQNSFEYLLTTISFFLIFIYVFNHKEKLKKPLIIIVFFFSILYSLFVLFTNFFIKQKWFFLIPNTGSNFVFPTYNSHNHLGDFLIIPLIINFYFLINKKNIILNLISIIFFLPFYLFSYSRSAYFSLLLTLVFLFFYNIKVVKITVLNKVVALLIILASAFFLTITSLQTKKITALSSITKILTQKFSLKSRSILSDRNIYFSHGFWAVKEKPLFGLGSKNYFYSSLKNSVERPYSWTDSGHNIFIDTFAENGILGGIIFLLIILLIIKKSKKNNLFFFLFLALLVNFQTDYTYRMFLSMLLFFIFAGLNYEEKKTIKLSWINIICSIFLLFTLNNLFLSKLALKKKNYSLSWFFYPLNNNIYQLLIEDELSKGSYKNGLYYLNLYGKFYSGDPSVLEYLGDIYLNFNEKEKAFFYYKKAYYWHPYQGKKLFRKVYSLEKELNGEREAKSFANTFLKLVENIKVKDFSAGFLRAEAQNFCQEIYREKCPYKL